MRSKDEIEALKNGGKKDREERGGVSVLQFRGQARAMLGGTILHVCQSHPEPSSSP